MERCCPRCKKILGVNECFFCLNCGYKLEDPLIYFPEKTRRIISPVFEKSKVSPKKSPKIKINRTFVIKVLFGLLIIISLSGFIFFLNKYFLKPKPIASQANTTVQREYLNTIKSDLNAKSGEFFIDDIGFFVTESPDFYIEGFDAKRFFELTNLLENKQSNASAILPYIGDHFVIFGDGINSNLSIGGVFELVDPQSFDLKNVIVSKGGEISVVDKFLLVAPDQETMEIMKLNRSKLQKSIMHNPAFNSQKALIDRSGQLLFVYMGDGKLEDMADFFNMYTSSGVLKDIINKIVTLGYNKFVLK